MMHGPINIRLDFSVLMCPTSDNQTSMNMNIYIYVCVRARAHVHERERERETTGRLWLNDYAVLYYAVTGVQILLWVQHLLTQYFTSQT